MSTTTPPPKRASFGDYHELDTVPIDVAASLIGVSRRLLEGLGTAGPRRVKVGRRLVFVVGDLARYLAGDR